MNHTDYADRIEKFWDFMKVGNIPILTDETVEKLVQGGFFTAPASTRFHGAYEGGLFDHSYEVADALVHLTRDCNLRWSRPESPYIVGMFHDICKMDQYEHPESEMTADGEPIPDITKWVYRKDCLLKGHGDKSVMMLASMIRLTEEEVMCIRYHMGAFTDEKEWGDYTRAVHRYPNVLWTHQADMLASHVLGV